MRGSTLFAADNHRRQKLSPLVDRINDRSRLVQLRQRAGSHTTLPWRKPDSNSQSHPLERVSFGDKPTQIPKAMLWQTNGRRRP
jgi:hypothetical protein